MIHCEFSGPNGFPQCPKELAIRWCGVCLFFLCTGCATIDKTSLDASGSLVILLDPELELGEDWENRRLRRGNTSYERVDTALGNTIRATGNRSASVLVRLFEPIALNCNELRWSWYVQRPQPSSELHTKGKDDVAASVFILFGDPGMFQDIPVPTLRYVWANDRHQSGEVIIGPYHKKYVRTIVARTGSPAGKKLVMEQANLSKDYLNAFGEAPKDGIHGVAIFTDNDDTNEPIVAHYGKIELLCTQG